MGPFGAKGEKGERSPIIPSLQDGEQVSADVQNGPSPAVGLSVGMAAVFLFSEMVGGGILTLPKAIENTGIPGMVYLTITASIMAFTGTLIGLTWRLVQERFPQYRGHVRYPYPAIGQVTYGRPGRVLISICLGAGLYGSSVVAFMLVVNNTGQMFTDMGHPVEFHGRSAVVAAVILPLMWFGTPKDFWPVGIVAMLTAFVSGMLIIASIFYDAAQNTGGAVEHVVPEFIDVTMAFGTVCYAFAGHVMFPTIQTDMKEANKFTYSVLAAMTGLVLVQCTISIAAYFVYGSDITDNILFAISGGTMRYVVQGLMTIHYLLAIIILINPVSQEIEDILNIPKEFNWKRCISRTILLGSILIITMIIPNFQLFLALVGGSTMFTTAIICPPLFHYKLCSLEGDWEKIYLSLGRRVLYAFIVVFGTISGLLCTFSTTYTLVVTARRHINNVTSTAEI